MQDISNAAAPENLCDVFTRFRQIHSYNTRPSSAVGNFYIKPSRLNFLRRNSVARFGSVLWNSLGTTTRELTRKQFKEKLHNALLNILFFEDNYIGSATLLQKTQGLLSYYFYLTSCVNWCLFWSNQFCNSVFHDTVLCGVWVLVELCFYTSHLMIGFLIMNRCHCPPRLAFAIFRQC